MQPAQGAKPLEADDILDPLDLDFTAPAQAAEEFPIIAAKPRQAPIANKVALVLDPDAQEAAWTVQTLREGGFQAVAEATPQGAARHMARLGAPALLVLEVGLQPINGFELVARLRANKNTKDIAVIFYTWHGERDDVVRALGAGADGYVVKSAEGAPLVKAAKRVLGL